MFITRRSFFRYCTLSAAALGLGPTQLGLLREALANPAAPSVVWLIGSACTGCVGTCASFGGIPASGSNPSHCMGVQRFTGRSTINISGCPANPDWVVWAIVQLLTGTPVALDEDSRPSALYTTSHVGAPEEPFIHNKCGRNPGVTNLAPATSFGQNGLCLRDLGCRGPNTKSRCEASWNGIGGHLAGQPHPGHWCIGVNANCHGCVEKTFPGPESFFEYYNPNP